MLSSRNKLSSETTEELDVNKNFSISMRCLPDLRSNILMELSCTTNLSNLLRTNTVLEATTKLSHPMFST